MAFDFLPNCVPEYFREQQEKYDHECELEMERNEYYARNREYRRKRREEGCAELDFYPDECRICSHGEEAPSRDSMDDFPTMICDNWKICQVFRREMKEAFPGTSWDEIKSWFSK